MATETCTATHASPTATGEVVTRCGKQAGHVAAGGLLHEGWVGVYPIRWRERSHGDQARSDG
jgi:hypothetical protein